MDKHKILIVDDDETILNITEPYLREAGYEVFNTTSKSEAVRLAREHAPDIVLLDLILPEGEALDLITGIRSCCNAGIIVLTGRGDTTEKIVSLEIGADDYLTKPAEMRELAARIKAVLRRREEPSPSAARQPGIPHGLSAEEKIYFDNWCLDCARLQLLDPQHNPVDLTTGEFRLLETLARAPNRVLTREKLFELTREEDYESYDRAIDIQIARLRRKLNDDPKSPQLIKTVRGAGYMFCISPRSEHPPQ